MRQDGGGNYVGFEVPLLADRPWSHALDVNLAARHSRCSTFGNTTNYQLGAAWLPTPALLIRPTRSRGYRYARETRWGRFRLRLDATYLSRYLKGIPKHAPPTSVVGNYFFWDPVWRVRALLSLDWDRGPVGATMRLRHYSALDESCLIPAQAEVGYAHLCDRSDSSARPSMSSSRVPTPTCSCAGHPGQVRS